MEKLASFCERLEEAMALRNMRNVDLSEATGIEKSRISYYRVGRNGPKHPSAEKLAKALRVDINWLLGFDVPMIPERKILLADKFQLLNEIGKEKAEEYIDDLLDNFKYRLPIESRI